jgi:hypothetical protein
MLRIMTSMIYLPRTQLHSSQSDDHSVKIMAIVHDVAMVSVYICTTSDTVPSTAQHVTC